MPKVLQIKTDSQLLERHQNFLKRWNITQQNNDFNGFRNCVVNLLNDDLPGNGYLFNNLDRYMFYRLKKKYASIVNISSLSSLIFSTSQLGRYLANTAISTFEQQIDFLWCLESILNYYVDYLNVVPEEEEDQETLKDCEDDWRRLMFIADGIAEALEYAGINAQLCQQSMKSEYLFYPKGAELLDEKLVNDNLNWLENYPNARKKFHKALVDSLAKKAPRDIIDDMRLAFELFLKDFLGNNKSLENQLNLIGQYLDSKDVPKEIRNMYEKIFNLYTTYNNENVKHSDNCSESEVEFIIYLTGAFIRLLIQINKK